MAGRESSHPRCRRKEQPISNESDTDQQERRDGRDGISQQEGGSSVLSQQNEVLA